jgi:predicted HNH restriction endonuclease
LAARLADTPNGIAALERRAEQVPQREKRISYYIERGTVGRTIKEARGNRCQVCEQLGQNPVAFHKSDGTPYSEAHHVQPVALLLPGSLGPSNIMVLCPNHHREVHYGDVQILSSGPKDWQIMLGGATLTIEKWLA